MILFFSAITIISAAIAAYSSETKRAILATWGAGMAVGSIYLDLGAETLAITQWMLSTLITVVMLFHAILFGEYKAAPKPGRTRAKKLFAGTVAGIFFSSLIIAGFGWDPVLLKDWTGGNPVMVMSQVGRAFIGRYLLAIEVLGLMLFLAAIGAGIVSRVERRNA